MPKLRNWYYNQRTPLIRDMQDNLQTFYALLNNELLFEGTGKGFLVYIGVFHLIKPRTFFLYIYSFLFFFSQKLDKCVHMRFGALDQ